MSQDGTSPLVLVGAVVAALFLLLVAILGALSGTAQAQGSVLGAVALWLPLVTAQAESAGIPPVLEMGLIAHESGGNYQATADDPNGTVDAGLGQINSGPQPADAHWAALGLLPDPFDPSKNVAASVGILAADIAGNGGSVTAGLYAYNGGTATNGEKFDPAYAPDVLRYVQEIQTAGTLAVWPAGGVLQQGVWSAPLSAGNGEAFFLVTAMAPVGKPLTWDGMQWFGLAPAFSLGATVGGLAVPLQPDAAAPAALQGIVPPDAAFWWFVAPVTSAPVTVTVRATFGGTKATSAVATISARAG